MLHHLLQIVASVADFQQKSTNCATVATVAQKSVALFVATPILGQSSFFVQIAQKRCGTDLVPHHTKQI